MVRVVLDTNIVVSAYLVPTGKPARILSLARQGKIDICLSEDILGEIKRTLLRPKLQKIHKATPQEIDKFLRASGGQNKSVPITPAKSVPPWE